MRRVGAIAIALGLIVWPGAGQARPPAYPHKAGVTAGALEADTTLCWNDAIKAMRDPAFQNPWIRNPATEGATAGVAGAAAARGFAAGIEGGKRFKLTYHDCLEAKGYTWRRPDEAAWQAQKKLERQAQVLTWSATPTPLHPEAPRDEFD